MRGVAERAESALRALASLAIPVFLLGAAGVGEAQSAQTQGAAPAQGGAAQNGTAAARPPAGPASPKADATTEDATSLDALEQRAAAEPDDLRAGAEYRQQCIAEKAYDRCIAFFETLAAEHPDSDAVLLNWGYAYVDKIPDAGAVTQVILADTALKRFTAALEIDDSWLALYTRGNSYVYWPAIFGRTKLGIADLEKAVARSEALGDAAPAYHAHAYAALGDAYWRLDDLATARSWWQKGHDRFPDDAPLAERLALDDAALDDYLHGVYEIGKRVDTGLAELWEAR